MTVLTSILQSILNAASYNRHELAAPRVILWPDEERLWTQCIEPLRASYPALWSLGDYSPDKATGPAAWLRYQLETQGGEDVPVIYLPDIGRTAFRSADQCPNQAQIWGHHTSFQQYCLVRSLTSIVSPDLSKPFRECEMKCFGLRHR